MSEIGCGIAVMAKASRPGRTKTRLVPPLTFEEAASLNTVFLKDAFANIAAAAHEARIQNAAPSEMRAAGFAPSIRLLAASPAPVITSSSNTAASPASA